MGVVIDFFIVAGENVVLGTLVRAYTIAFLRMKFGLSVKISRKKMDRELLNTNSSFEELASLHSWSQ